MQSKSGRKAILRRETVFGNKIRVCSDVYLRKIKNDRIEIELFAKLDF